MGTPVQPAAHGYTQYGRRQIYAYANSVVEARRIDGECLLTSPIEHSIASHN